MSVLVSLTATDVVLLEEVRCLHYIMGLPGTKILCVDVLLIMIMSFDH